VQTEAGYQIGFKKFMIGKQWFDGPTHQMKIAIIACGNLIISHLIVFWITGI
jgi:hypothetical protein